MAKITFSHVLIKVGLPLIVLLAGVGAGAVIINSKPEIVSNEQGPELRAVKAVQVFPQAMSVLVESQGTVEAQQRISLVPQVSGTISWVSPKFVNGGQFAAGEEILRIDASDYHLGVTSAQANVAEAQQQLESIKAQAEQAEADWALLERTGTKRTLKPTALALRAPQLAGAQARLLSAQAELEKARLMLERTVIRAPFNGMLSAKQVDFGQYLGAGTTLGQLSSSEVLEIRLALSERDLNRLALDQLEAGIPVEVSRLNGSGDDRWQGHLVRSEGLIDERTRNLTLVAQFKAQQLLSPSGSPLTLGQFVKAGIQGREMAEVVYLPRTALHNGHSVFIVDAESRLREREITVLEVYEDRVMVQGGLRAGDIVSISPLTSSVEGQSVKALLAEGVL